MVAADSDCNDLVVSVQHFLVLDVDSVVDAVLLEAVTVEVVEAVNLNANKQRDEHLTVDVVHSSVSSEIAVPFQLFEVVKDCIVHVLFLEDVMMMSLLLLLSSVEVALIESDLETVHDSPEVAVSVLAEHELQCCSVAQSEEHHEEQHVDPDLSFHVHFVAAPKASMWMARFHSFRIVAVTMMFAVLLDLVVVDAETVNVESEAVDLSVHC